MCLLLTYSKLLYFLQKSAEISPLTSNSLLSYHQSGYFYQTNCNILSTFGTPKLYEKKLLKKTKIYISALVSLKKFYNKKKQKMHFPDRFIVETLKFAYMEHGPYYKYGDILLNYRMATSKIT